MLAAKLTIQKKHCRRVLKGVTLTDVPKGRPCEPRQIDDTAWVLDCVEQRNGVFTPATLASFREMEDGETVE